MADFVRMGIRFNYLVEGDGRPIVALHGLGGDLNQPRDLIGEMPDYQRVFLDCRAHGQTSPVGPCELLSFDQLADDAVALVSQLDVEQPVLMGISMGAAICANVAARYPGLARALVLVRPAWLDAPNARNLALFPAIAHLLREYGAKEGKKKFSTMPEYLSIQAAAPAVAASLASQFDAPMAVERAARLERLPASCPVASMTDCQPIGCPVLVIATDSDPVHPLEFGRTWARAIPGAGFRRIPSKSQSAEAHTSGFRQALREFLSGLDQETV